MANGDIAAARGWTTFTPTQDRKLGYDNDNYGLDRTAEQAKRLDDAEQAINQPIFAVRRGTNVAGIAPSGTWVPAPYQWYATPTINTGFSTTAPWSVGNVQLTIARPGIYRVAAHLQWEDATDYNRTAIAVVKNTTEANDQNTLARQVNDDGGTSLAASDLVRLVAGDVVRMLVFQRNNSGKQHAPATGPADMSMSVEWVRA